MKKYIYAVEVSFSDEPQWQIREVYCADPMREVLKRVKVDFGPTEIGAAVRLVRYVRENVKNIRRQGA